MRKQREPSVGAVAGGSSPEERERQVVGPHSGRGCGDLELRIRVGHVEWSRQPHASQDLCALTHGVEERKRRQPRGFVRRPREPFPDLCEISPRLVVNVLPVSAKSDRLERLERLILMAGFGELLCDAGEASNRGRTRPRRLERLDLKGGQRALVQRKAEL